MEGFHGGKNDGVTALVLSADSRQKESVEFGVAVVCFVAESQVARTSEADRGEHGGRGAGALGEFGGRQGLGVLSGCGLVSCRWWLLCLLRSRARGRQFWGILIITIYS